MRHKISVTCLKLSRLPILGKGTVPKHAQEPCKYAAKFSSMYKIYFCFNRIKHSTLAICARWNANIRGSATTQGITNLEQVLRSRVFKARQTVYWRSDILFS